MATNIDWGGLFQGGVGAYGFNEMMNKYDDMGEDIQTGIGGLMDQTRENTKFQPWGVTTGIGNTQGTAGGINSQLSGPQQYQSDWQRTAGQNAQAGAMAPRDQREAMYYDKIRAMQRPGEERNTQTMNNNQTAAGRGGMFTNQYGGTPEQYANSMAQAEARNAASFGAIQGAEQEAQSLFNRGSSLIEQQYMPYDQMRADTGMGLNNQQLQQHGALQGQGMMNELGLGNLTAQTNLANTQNNLYGNMMKGLAPMAGGFGDAAGGALNGGIDWLKKQMGFTV
jgi:hypothetical protein